MPEFAITREDDENLLPAASSKLTAAHHREGNLVGIR